MKKILGPALGVLIHFTSAAADFGPPAGTQMPAFEAQDQSGRTRTLQNILGKNGAVLVFFRSADW